MLIGIVAGCGEVSANRVGGAVERIGRVGGNIARPVVRSTEKPDIIHDDVGLAGERVHRLLEGHTGVKVGEEQLRAGSDVMHDLEKGCALGSYSREPAGG